MKIAIDARSLTTQPTGIGHYLLAAVNVWSALAPDVQFVLMANKPLHRDAKSLLTSAANVTWMQTATRLYQRNGLLWLLCGFSPEAKNLGATHLWGAGGLLPMWGTSGLTQIVTVHDLVYKTMPWTMSRKSRLAYGFLAGRSLLSADFLWSVSRFTLQEVDRNYHCSERQVRVVGSGLNPLRRSIGDCGLASQLVLEKYAVTPRTLLFVGTLEPRKNLIHLIRLMPQLAEHDMRLLVVGCRGWGKQAFASHVDAPGYPVDRVVFADYVDDQELQTLYTSVGALVWPSLLEGFGLPLLEAMSQGCPVVAANNSAMPEVVGSGGVLVSGWEHSDWVDALLGVAQSRPDYAAAAKKAAAAHDMAVPSMALMNLLRSGADCALPQSNTTGGSTKP